MCPDEVASEYTLSIAFGCFFDWALAFGVARVIVSVVGPWLVGECSSNVTVCRTRLLSTKFTSSLALAKTLLSNVPARYVAIQADFLCALLRVLRKTLDVLGYILTTNLARDSFRKWESETSLRFLQQVGHAGGKFLRRRGDCKDSSELSSGGGSPWPGDAMPGCLRFAGRLEMMC